MGTRGNIIIIDDNHELVRIYRQYDSYPRGLGKDLQDILKGAVIVNGFGTGTPKNAHNGMGCMAATLIASLKNGIGNTYIHLPCDGAVSEDWIDYTYRLREKEGSLWCEVFDFGSLITADFLDNINMGGLE